MRWSEPLLDDILILECLKAGNTLITITAIVKNIRRIRDTKIIDLETTDLHKRISFSINSKCKVKKMIKGPQIVHFDIVPNEMRVKNTRNKITNPLFVIV